LRFFYLEKTIWQPCRHLQNTLLPRKRRIEFSLSIREKKNTCEQGCQIFLGT
jgi:hypothetical protein